METLKKIAKAALTIGFGASVACAVFYSAYTSLTEYPSLEEITDFDNVSQQISPAERNTVKKSRKSTVQVLSLSFDGMVGSSTGTYFKVDGIHYILTVAHGLIGPCAVTKIWTPEDGLVDCISVPVFDPLIDYAIIEVGEIPSRTPINIRRSLPNARQWKAHLSSQSKVYYTGYPNSTGPLTVPGRIMGYDNGDYIYLHSYAWGGASGSGVYSVDGMLIGYLLAIDVGSTEYGIQALEGVVVVVPTFKIDWAAILK